MLAKIILFAVVAAILSCGMYMYTANSALAFHSSNRQDYGQTCHFFDIKMKVHKTFIRKSQKGGWIHGCPMFKQLG